jgi:hypothetical protein
VCAGACAVFGTDAAGGAERVVVAHPRAPSDSAAPALFDSARHRATGAGSGGSDAAPPTASESVALALHARLNAGVALLQSHCVTLKHKRTLTRRLHQLIDAELCQQPSARARVLADAMTSDGLACFSRGLVHFQPPVAARTAETATDTAALGARSRSVVAVSDSSTPAEPISLRIVDWRHTTDLSGVVEVSVKLEGACSRRSVAHLAVSPAVPERDRFHSPPLQLFGGCIECDGPFATELSAKATFMGDMQLGVRQNVWLILSECAGAAGGSTSVVKLVGSFVVDADAVLRRAAQLTRSGALTIVPRALWTAFHVLLEAEAPLNMAQLRDRLCDGLSARAGATHGSIGSDLLEMHLKQMGARHAVCAIHTPGWSTIALVIYALRRELPKTTVLSADMLSAGMRQQMPRLLRSMRTELSLGGHGLPAASRSVQRVLEQQHITNLHAWRLLPCLSPGREA